MSATKRSRSSRGVKVNKRYKEDENDDDDAQPRRRCERPRCPSVAPICFAGVADKCAGNKWTSRWYHISPAEHFCNECFDYFYRSHKHGYQLFEEWKREWSTYGRSEPTLKKFMADTLVPFWVQCTVPECQKWRQLSKDMDLTPSFIEKYVCGMTASGLKKGNQPDACSTPEDERVVYSREDIWLHLTSVPPYLKHSPAAPMLMGYYPDGVGMSATDPILQSRKAKASVRPCCEFLSPFVQQEERQLACMVMPDMMGEGEIAVFPLLAEDQPYMYLAIRNHILATWSQNVKQWLTEAECARQLICRGLNRACAMHLLGPILSYLTSAGYINVGLLTIPPSLHPPNASQCEVLVIGAGISGLAAAHRLNNFGLKVKVLESKSRLGGRVCDKHQDGVCFSQGAQLLAGSVNNPMALMAYQSGQPVHKILDRCQIMMEGGKVVDPVTDRRLDFHFNAMLDVIGQWRLSGKPDVSVLQKFNELHQEFVEETQLNFTQEEQQILQFHLAFLEYIGGCALGQLSASHWDQHEALPQFGEPHLLLPHGYTPLLDSLAQGLDIVYSAKVSEIDYSGEKVVVRTAGESFTADKVIVTLPLGVLRSGTVVFQPSLPVHKEKAIASLGVGKMEKVILQFSENFWRSKVKGDDFFGRVPASESERGLFNIFYTVKCKKPGTSKVCHLLVTHIVGQAVETVCEKSEEEIKDLCLETLRGIFPGKVPEPVRWAVTSWHKDPDFQMSQTYLPVGVDGHTLDVMAESVSDKVYFAGEATNRQFPQSVAGAYLSGIREATKILDGITDANESTHSDASDISATNQT